MENEIKEMLGLILNKLDGLESRIDSLESRMESRMDRLESRMDRLESRMDRLESRQDEIYWVVKAIEHSNQVHGAEIDNLKFKVSHMEGTINAVGDVITTRKAI
ncbi:M domain protein [Desulfosporosinus metallidurans]|uniref:M domain protein n=1 Tax=Desulfosporosinus metallidurans TaxID=1888891 RepID=A0A1Q8QXS6_9FIRM|nr:M domain protein [Desulfosporosinus metallidurans]OLN32131.1 hypothetical protein DSOL_2004 [Desulfosporosinus metallidurans]